MAYKIINGKLAAETDKNYLDVSSSKRELFDALKAQVKRAEAAEARAAALEDTLQKQLSIRDDLVIRMNELEAERDELARKLEQAQKELNNYHRLQADIDMGVIVLEYPRSDED